MKPSGKVGTFFDASMVCDSGGYSPSGTKPQAVVDDWMERGWIHVQPFSPVDGEQLLLAHSRRYVEGVLSGTVANGHGNRNLQVAESTRWTVGSMVAAARAAIESKVACSPSSGFHHGRHCRNFGKAMSKSFFTRQVPTLIETILWADYSPMKRWLIEIGSSSTTAGQSPFQ